MITLVIFTGFLIMYEVFLLITAEYIISYRFDIPTQWKICSPLIAHPSFG